MQNKFQREKSQRTKKNSNSRGRKFYDEIVRARTIFCNFPLVKEVLSELKLFICTHNIASNDRKLLELLRTMEIM